MYSFFCGSNGSRAVPFLEQVLTCLRVSRQEPKLEIAKQSTIDTIVPVVIALREILQREEHCRFHERLIDLTASIEHTIKTTGLEEESAQFQIIAEALSEIRAMVGRSQKGGLAAVRLTANMEMHNIDEVFDDIILPSNFHDNDKRDIAEISILPTESEIRCTQEDFLPSTDIRQPHFLKEPVARHIDTYFRLYRYDNFGEMKEALGALMIAVETNPALLDTPRLNLGNVRAYSFPGTTVSDITFHDRLGMQALLSFPQPHFVSNCLNAGQRAQAWTDSRRLGEGVLLCYIWHDGQKYSLLLFTVSEKRLGQKEDIISLSSSSVTATIHVKLATLVQSEFEKLVRLGCLRTKGYLIEFPGIIPETFTPVLENLQDMQRHCRLPFQKWLLPRESDDDELVVPSPLYARKPGFKFSLRPILQFGARLESDLFVSSTASPNDENLINEIENHTSLDRGQAVALVAALTSEYALIQGPPGTGKSYLGVNLMRVLLESASTAGMGPIIVV